MYPYGDAQAGRPRQELLGILTIVLFHALKDRLTRINIHVMKMLCRCTVYAQKQYFLDQNANVGLS